ASGAERVGRRSSSCPSAQSASGDRAASRARPARSGLPASRSRAAMPPLRSSASAAGHSSRQAATRSSNVVTCRPEGNATGGDTDEHGSGLIPTDQNKENGLLCCLIREDPYRSVFIRVPLSSSVGLGRRYFFSSAACAAASRAIGTRGGEQLT